MFIDPHLHTSAISKCCAINAEDTMILAKSLGYDGAVITNHYTHFYFDESSYDNWLEEYISEWENCRSLAQKHDFRIFCGVEVTMSFDPRLHILIYGTDDRFLRQNRMLCHKTIPELYALCRENGCAMVQAHPFRGGTTVQDTKYLDGIEINCHPKYFNSYCDDIISTATENELAVTVGCDYHHDSYRPTGGMILPDDIKTDAQLAEYILTSKNFKLKVHEPANQEIFELEYNRN